ncbi:hypothetical protein H4582DRAFT_1965707, partial [Lactarius indigo]
MPYASMQPVGMMLGTVVMTVVVQCTYSSVFESSPRYYGKVCFKCQHTHLRSLCPHISYTPPNSLALAASLSHL